LGFGEGGFAERLAQKVIKTKDSGSNGGTTSTAKLSAATIQTSRAVFTAAFEPVKKQIEAAQKSAQT
jgi:hypothetical protein